MNSPAFDLNDPGFRAIVDLFVAELPERAASLERALVERDRESLRRLGHQLKGAAGCYGFDELTHPAAELQRVCDESQDKQAIAEAATVLVRACQEAANRNAAASAPA